MANSARDEWFINEAIEQVNLTARQRVVLATEWLRNKTVLNISIPVTKEVRSFEVETGGISEKELKQARYAFRSGEIESDAADFEEYAAKLQKNSVKKTKGQRTVVTERSKPGEFPRADTTLLRKSIFGVVQNPEPGIFDGYVGTPIDYGVWLELQLDRSFLLRSFAEEKPTLLKILTSEGMD